MSEYNFRLPALAPLGFYLADKLEAKVPYKLSVDRERQVRAKLAQIFGTGRVEVFYRIHRAQKITLTAATVVLTGCLLTAGSMEPVVCLMVLGLCILVHCWPDSELDKKIKVRKRLILIDFHEFINTLAILVGAGLPLQTALHRAASGRDIGRPLYKELSALLTDLSSGKSAVQAYEDFAHRCKIPEVTRFVSTVLQNLNRGGNELYYTLRSLAQEAWEKRRDLAKRQGEEAAAKLVFPMVMIFVAVAMIILAPAILTIGG